MPETGMARKGKRVQRTEIGADEARQKLGELIDRAAFGGERFVLKRHGKPPVVALVSIADLEKIEGAA